MCRGGRLRNQKPQAFPDFSRFGLEARPHRIPPRTGGNWRPRSRMPPPALPAPLPERRCPSSFRLPANWVRSTSHAPGISGIRRLESPIPNCKSSMAGCLKDPTPDTGCCSEHPSMRRWASVATETAPAASRLRVDSCGSSMIVSFRLTSAVVVCVLYRLSRWPPRKIRHSVVAGASRRSPSPWLLKPRGSCDWSHRGTPMDVARPRVSPPAGINGVEHPKTRGKNPHQRGSRTNRDSQ